MASVTLLCNLAVDSVIAEFTRLVIYMYLDLW